MSAAYRNAVRRATGRQEADTAGCLLGLLLTAFGMLYGPLVITLLYGWFVHDQFSWAPAISYPVMIGLLTIKGLIFMHVDTRGWEAIVPLAGGEERTVTVRRPTGFAQSNSQSVTVIVAETVVLVFGWVVAHFSLGVA